MWRTNRQKAQCNAVEALSRIVTHQDSIESHPYIRLGVFLPREQHQGFEKMREVNRVIALWLCLLEDEIGFRR